MALLPPIAPGLIPRRFTQRLGVRLASLMAVALLPLGIVAHLQTSNLAREAKGRSEEALLGQTLRAASGEIRVISRARGLVAGLATVLPNFIADDAACSALMAGSIADMPEAALLAFVPQSGVMTCASNGATFDYSGIPLFAEVVAARSPVFVVSPGPVSGRSVLGVVLPVFDAQGAYLGYVGAWLPHDRLRVLQTVDEGLAESGVQFWTINNKGEVLTASMGLEAVASSLPAKVALASLVGEAAQVFSAPSVGGVQTTYASMPIVPNQLYIMSSWTAQRTVSDFWFGLGRGWVPIFMWVAGLAVSIWAAEMLVVRHVRKLSDAIADFARGGRRETELRLDAAPLELHEMAVAYSTMTQDIMRNEASLEDEVHQKEVLLREVHHRVKNNLQLIASIMNMQMRQARTPEAKELLKGLQERIMSLATIHRGLYQTTGLTDIHAHELLSDITRQTINLATGPASRLTVTTDFDDISLTPDQAVPLSLLLTEALTNAIKYARGAVGQDRTLSVRMKRAAGERAVLSVINSMSDAAEEASNSLQNTGTGLGAQLQAAFAQQLGGTISQGLVGGSYRMEMSFAVAPLTEAENRKAQAEA
jgi:two-component sensor histidine kinase/heme exporter protein D